MHPFLNTAIKAAREAGNIICRGFDRMDKVTISEKSHNRDLVTNIDKASEEQILDILKTAYPAHRFLGEESGNTSEKNADQDSLWIIDPLDGTMNFSHGFPHFSISIAFQYKGRLELGLVYDPIRQDLFTAERGSGAQKNNHRLRVGKATQLKEGLFATGFPYKEQANYHDYFRCLESISRQAHDVRRTGSAALDLAYVAAGHLDGFWEPGLAAWDMAAGALLIKEAGGLVGDFNGGEDYLEKGNIIAANPKVFKELLREIQLINH
jgi:myo-inositol-1(or 4)-monophosphatase